MAAKFVATSKVVSNASMDTSWYKMKLIHMDTVMHVIRTARHASFKAIFVCSVIKITL